MLEKEEEKNIDGTFKKVCIPNDYLNSQIRLIQAECSIGFEPIWSILIMHNL